MLLSVPAMTTSQLDPSRVQAALGFQATAFQAVVIDFLKAPVAPVQFIPQRWIPFSAKV